MQAKHLSDVLYRYFLKAEGAAPHERNYDQRFNALRGCGLLPRGRENRERMLTNSEIAFAILGTVASQPDWAGFNAVALAKLRPAGGVAASFHDAATILDAIVLLLADQDTSASLFSLSISCAEWGINSHGYAVLIYRAKGGETAVASFVPQTAVSLFHPGAEKEVTPFPRLAPVSREIVFSNGFFRNLIREIEQAKLYSLPPQGDGSEYASTEQEGARRKRLGIRSHAIYLNLGIDTYTRWPREETLARFGEYELVLMPRTKDKAASVHIDLMRYRLNVSEANTIINRFLSIIAWVNDSSAVAQDGWSGNPVPVAVSRRELGYSVGEPWFFNRIIPSSPEVLRALALYREGRNAQMNFLVSYAVLNFYRLIEIRYSNKNGPRAWMKTALPLVVGQLREGVLKTFDELRGARAPEVYLYESCRIAVAHAGGKSDSDPDDNAEITRLHMAADILHALARHFIATELGVTDGNYAFMPAQHIE